MAIELNFPRRNMSLFFLSEFEYEKRYSLKKCKKRGYICLTDSIQFMGFFVCV